eukprot:snap_masked-scaffold_5-processed-gene-7.25-mRNA-1 protein AED:1.00 eAED:1.00 QI:0/-1/0/0/-1/1/1/0/65
MAARIQERESHKKPTSRKISIKKRVWRSLFDPLPRYPEPDHYTIMRISRESRGISEMKRVCTDNQ